MVLFCSVKFFAPTCLFHLEIFFLLFFSYRFLLGHQAVSNVPSCNSMELFSSSQMDLHRESQVLQFRIIFLSTGSIVRHTVSSFPGKGIMIFPAPPANVSRWSIKCPSHSMTLVLPRIPSHHYSFLGKWQPGGSLVHRLQMKFKLCHTFFLVLNSAPRW